MKRTTCFLLALLLCLPLLPAVRADVIYEPEDSFYWEHRGECQREDRAYTANGPDTTTVAYVNPESAAVAGRVPKGEQVWIYYTYEDENGIDWGFCDHYTDGWTGWIPMDYLVLVYDYICFQEEFGSRITEQSGTIGESGEERVYFWLYPGSEAHSAAMFVEAEYLPEYQQTFVDDAGRTWGYVTYYMGIRNVWVCLDAPTADYQTLYAEHAPQQVTHPTAPDTVPADIKPSGISMGGILATVCILSVLCMGFLMFTRKKK